MMARVGKERQRYGRFVQPVTGLAASCLLLAITAAAPARSGPPLSTCFWEGPISMKQRTTRGFDGHYFNFPEKSATYWLARFKLPSGAHLIFHARFSHSRYQSINAYSSGAPSDALSDVQTQPDRGSTNPFVIGHRRDLARRSYTVTVLDQSPPSSPSQRAPNTLYAHPQGTGPEPSIELLYRVYEPDRGLGLSGGTPLPAVQLVMANGHVLNEAAACTAVNDPDRSIPVQTTPAAEWTAATHAPGCDPNTNPAYNPVRWERFFTLDYASLAVVSDCTAAGRRLRLSMPVQPQGGFYSNRDNAYIYAHLSRRFGPVLMIEAQLPTVPRTYDHQRYMGGGQLRYWSICSNESRVTTRAVDCLSDRQVPLRRGRQFLIVVSRRSDRPRNATSRCGVGWIDWGDRGDGAGNPDYGLLIIRNMLPSQHFTQAIQDVARPGIERQVMGPYFPRAAYTTKAGFQARSCPARG